MFEVFNIIAHIASAGDSAGNVQQPVYWPQMSVHVKESGQQRFAAAVNALSAAWDLRGGSGSNRRNTIAVDHDGLIFAHRGLF